VKAQEAGKPREIKPFLSGYVAGGDEGYNLLNTGLYGERKHQKASGIVYKSLCSAT
jgi:hypothetical protein